MARGSSVPNERDLYVASFILQQSRDNHTGVLFEGRKLCELQINHKIGRQETDSDGVIPLYAQD